MARLNLVPFQAQLEHPFANSSVTWPKREGLEVELACTRCGLHGSGEASPLPGYSSDTLEQCSQWLQHADPALVDRLAEAPSSEALQKELLNLPEPCPPAARFSLETAAFDLLGKRLQRPLWQLLRGPHDGLEDRSLPPTIPLYPVLSGQCLKQIVDEAERAWLNGVRGFKLKVGPGSLSGLALDALRALTERFGAKVTIRLDANQRFDPGAWPSIEKSLAPFGSLLLEEPWALEASPWPCETPLALAFDESLQGRSPSWVEQALVSTPRLCAVVLKPTALGGLLHCLRLAQSARALGKLALVSHTLEGPTGWMATAHLALALGGSSASGLWPLSHQDRVRRHFVRGGELRAPNVHGLDTIH